MHQNQACPNSIVTGNRLSQATACERGPSKPVGGNRSPPFPLGSAKTGIALMMRTTLLRVLFQVHYMTAL